MEEKLSGLELSQLFDLAVYDLVGIELKGYFFLEQGYSGEYFELDSDHREIDDCGGLLTQFEI